jgi:hypothetical protein
MLAQFPGHSREDLIRVWEKYKERCGELGRRWEGAGRPRVGLGNSE